MVSRGVECLNSKGTRKSCAGCTIFFTLFIRLFYMFIKCPLPVSMVTYINKTNYKMSSKKGEKYEDLSYLHDELKKQVQADKIYWLQNDAKIRAVTTAQSYDEFRNIVQAAHLIPLSKDDKMNKMEGKLSWNRSLNK